MKKTVLPVISLIGLLALWEACVRIFDVPLYILPAPSKVIVAFVNDFYTIIENSWITLIEALLGMLIATMLGIVIAIIMDRYGLLKAAVYPLLIISQTIPIIVLAPIFVIYLGFGLAPKILTVVLMCFFPIAVGFVSGLGEVDVRLVNLVRSYGATTFQVYMKVKIPAAWASLISGLRIAATYSVTGAVVGEWLASDSGLGYYMLRAKNGFMLDKVFASVLAVIILSLLMNAIVKLIGRKHYEK